MDNKKFDDEIVIENCESCQYPVAAMRPHSGMALCDICTPWVEASMRRTGQIPSWYRDFSKRKGQFGKTHQVFLEFGETFGDEHWCTSYGIDTPAPTSEQGWIQFFQWALDGAAPEILARVRGALDAREATLDSDTPWLSVDAIANRLKMAQDVVNIAGHSVTIDETGTWVDDGYNSVLFGHRAHELHCQRLGALPELMFDRYHGLDSRPLEELAYLYWREPWMSLIDSMTGAMVPTTPAIRDEFSRMATGAVGNKVADRCRLAILLWSTRIEREFLTCDRSAWKLSFQWVRELVEEFAGSARAMSDGIYVDGVSGNLYRIAPVNSNSCSGGPARNAGDYFEVRKVARVGDDMTNPICIHVKEPENSEGRYDAVLGDIVAGLLMALRNDLISAEVIGPLFRHLPAKYRTRERSGDRRGWRRRFRDVYPGMDIDQRLRDMLDSPEEEE